MYRFTRALPECSSHILTLLDLIVTSAPWSYVYLQLMKEVSLLSVIKAIPPPSIGPRTPPTFSGRRPIFQVTSGHRITLTYNLFIRRGLGEMVGNNSALDDAQLPVYKEVRAALVSPVFFPNGIF